MRCEIGSSRESLQSVEMIRWPVLLRGQVGLRWGARVGLCAICAEIAPEAVAQRDDGVGKERTSGGDCRRDALQNPPDPETSDGGKRLGWLGDGVERVLFREKKSEGEGRAGDK